MTKKQTLLEQVTWARDILNISHRSTFKDIKTSFNRLIKKWHPDKCHDMVEDNNEKSNEIIVAYKVLKDYCDNYVYSFSDDEVDEQAPYEEKWLRSFGKDPMWGI